MAQIYLAINYGQDGWSLNSHDTALKALEAVQKKGFYSGNEWKILKELDIKVEEE